MARILVVDDDITSLELASLVCEQDGHDVIRAEDGRVAMRDLRIHEVDLVLTDIMMPDVDGFSVVQLARQIQPGIKVIVVSAIGDRVTVNFEPAGKVLINTAVGGLTLADPDAGTAQARP